MARPLLLGIEIGGTKLQLGVGHGDGEPVALRRQAIRPERGGEGIREQIHEEARALLWSRNLDLPNLAAVGVGFGGPVDAGRGVVTTSHQVEGWDGFPLADWLRKDLGVEQVAVQNDADTAGLGEARAGAGKGLSPVLYVTIGSGIGGGLIIDGKIYRGAGAGAAEVGHLRVGGKALELTSSGWSIGRSAREEPGKMMLDLVDGDRDSLTAEVVGVAAGLGDERAIAILDGATSAMAEALSHVVALVAPRRIILGGGVSLLGEDLWLGPIRRKLEAIAFKPFRGTYDVVPAKLGESVVIVGALALARDLCKDEVG